MVRRSIFVSAGLLCFIFCNSKTPTQSPGPSPGPITVEQLKIPDFAVPGWSQSAQNGDTFAFYPIESLYGDVPGEMDGGAIPYDSLGCKEVAYQKLTGPAPMLYASYAMDFVTSDKAAAMFDHSKASAASPAVAVPDFDTSAAFATEGFSSVEVYAHLNRFYFEITLIGVTDSAAALDAARDFLTIYKGKIK
jgi:hypothetical protein